MNIYMFSCAVSVFFLPASKAPTSCCNDYYMLCYIYKAKAKYQRTVVKIEALKEELLTPFIVIDHKLHTSQVSDKIGLHRYVAVQLLIDTKLYCFHDWTRWFR